MILTVLVCLEIAVLGMMMIGLALVPVYMYVRYRDSSDATDFKAIERLLQEDIQTTSTNRAPTENGAAAPAWTGRRCASSRHNARSAIQLGYAAR